MLYLTENRKCLKIKQKALVQLLSKQRYFLGQFVERYISHAAGLGREQEFLKDKMEGLFTSYLKSNREIERLNVLIVRKW